MPSNPFELAVALSFQSSAMLDEIKSFEQPFEALILSAFDDLQLLMKTISGDVASDDVISSGALCLQMLQAFYMLIPLLSFVLSEPML